MTTRIGGNPPVRTPLSTDTVKGGFRVNTRMNVPILRGFGRPSTTEFAKSHTLYDDVINNFSALKNADIEATFEPQVNLNPNLISEESLAATNQYWTDEQALA